MTTASAFRRRFPSEAACIAYLEKVRWDGEPACHRCGCVRVYRYPARKNYVCAGCRRSFTARNGTIFEDSKLPLLTWFEAIYLVTTSRPGVSSVELAERLGTTQKTAWFVLQRIQYAVRHQDFAKPLSGDVEMDDHEVSRDGGGKKAQVIAVVERQGEARMEAVERVDRKTAHDLVNRHVEPGSTLMTDSFLAYDRLGQTGVTHETVNHGREYVRGTTHTNTAEGLFGNFSRRLKGVHVHVSAKHLQKYCSAYAYRYNVRGLDPLDRFEAWFSHLCGRLTYRALIA